jgi:hypothetical protein
MFDLEPYKLPIDDAPSRVRDGAARGVRVEDFPGRTDASRLLGGDGALLYDGVLRAPDGRVLVTCVTDLPGVTPAMVDWWFGWHLPSSERYRLWHPKAHVAAVVQEDRSHLKVDRERYLHNVSHVDEYIGTRLMKLSIAFFSSAEFGITDLDSHGATAICARTTDRSTKGEGGCLIHYVLPTAQGAQMRSAFWLGEITHTVPIVDRVLHGVLNSKAVRKVVVSDRMALDLLIHCGEEMNHLARFLPRLYGDAHAANEA